MEENDKTFMWLKRYAEKYGREKLIQFQSGFSPAFDSPFNAFLMGKVSMELQGVWFPMFIRRHKPQLQFGVAPFPCAAGVAGPRSYLETDVIGIPRGCKHVEEAWMFIEWVQKKGAATLCRRQGKNMMWSKVPDWYYQGHPNPEVKIFADLAASPNSFIYPQSLVNAEYREEMNRIFQHIWNWPVERERAAELKDSSGTELTGPAREQKISQLCEQEIRNTLRLLRETYQKKLDTAIERQKLQATVVGDEPGPAPSTKTEREAPREGGRQ
jgi:ABC-type glycerol-3-phosphate transport system substrate-binding protein